MPIFRGVQEFGHRPIRTPKDVLCQENIKQQIKTDSKIIKNTKYSHKNTQKHQHIVKHIIFA